MDTINTLSLLVGSSFLTGVNAYATIGFLGLFSRLGLLSLPSSLEVLANPIVISIALCLYLVEFIADKIPAFDTFWDSIQTFIRIPAGAILAYAAVGDVNPELKLGAFLLGGSLAFSAHATKSSIRAVVNLSPEPFSNWLLSLGEDGALLICLWLMFHFPFLMLAIVGLFLIFFVWFIPKIFRTFAQIFRKFLALFRTSPQPQ